MRYVENPTTTWWERILFGGDLVEVCDTETGEAFYASREEWETAEGLRALQEQEAESSWRRGEVEAW